MTTTDDKSISYRTQRKVRSSLSRLMRARLKKNKNMSMLPTVTRLTSQVLGLVMVVTRR